MKFTVREGFVVQTTSKVDLGDGRFELQTNTFYGKQTVDLTADQADAHFHKLEPLDKAAIAYLEGKVAPAAPAQALDLSAEALALVQAMATETAKAIVAAMQTPAQATAPTA